MLILERIYDGHPHADAHLCILPVPDGTGLLMRYRRGLDFTPQSPAKRVIK